MIIRAAGQNGGVKGKSRQRPQAWGMNTMSSFRRNRKHTHTHHTPPPPHHPSLVQCQLTGEMESLQYVIEAMDPIFSKESVFAYKKSLAYNFKGIIESQESM